MRSRGRLLLLLAMLLLPTGCGGRAARLNEQGNEAFSAGDFGAAQVAYSEAIDAEGELLEAHYNLANALQAQAQPEEAALRLEETALRAAATAAPASSGFAALRRAEAGGTPVLGARAWFNLGNLRYGQEDFPGAADAYREALRLAPDDVDAKVNLELALRRQQQDEPSPTPSPEPSPTPEENAEDPTATPSPTPSPTPEPPAPEGTPTPEPAEPETPTMTPTPPPTPTPPTAQNGTPDLTPTPGEGSPTPALEQPGAATPVLPGNVPMTAEQALRLLEAAASESTSLQEQLQRGVQLPSGTDKDW
jgi:tetratricopeptide (TPR) repeat protein